MDKAVVLVELSGPSVSNYCSFVVQSCNSTLNSIK